MVIAIQSVLLKKRHFKTRTNASQYIRKNKWKVNVPSDNKEDKVEIEVEEEKYPNVGHS